MATITTRSGKGSPLTNTEVDDNFINLNTELASVDASKLNLTGGTLTGDLTIQGDINLGGSGANGNYVIETEGQLYIKANTVANDVSYTSLILSAGNSTGTYGSYGDVLVEAGGKQVFRADGGIPGVVFNDDSHDMDFRVESDGSTHMLFVDAANNRVGIGDSSPDRTLEVAGNVRTRGLGSEDNAASLFVGLDSYNTIGVSGPQYGLYVSQAGARYASQTAVWASTPAPTGRYGSSYKLFAGETSVSTTANQKGYGLDVSIFNPTGNYTTEYGAKTYVESGMSSVAGFDSRTRAYGGYFETQGNGTLIGVRSLAVQGTAVASGAYAAAYEGYVNGNLHFQVRDEYTVINESSADHDFRVESDTNTHALFVDASENRIGMGTAPSSALHIYNDAAELRLQDTGTGNAANPYITFYGASSRNGYFGFAGGSDSDWYLHNEMDGGDIALYVGVSTQGLRVNSDSSGVIINEGSADRDFRVESDGNSHMLYVEGATNRVAIGHNDPAGILDVYKAYSSSETPKGIVLRDNTTTSNVALPGIWWSHSGDRFRAAIRAENDGPYGRKSISFWTSTTQSWTASESDMQMRAVVKDHGDFEVVNNTAAATNSQSLPGRIRFRGRGWNTSVGDENIDASISMTGAYTASWGQTDPEFVFKVTSTDASNRRDDSIVFRIYPDDSNAANYTGNFYNGLIVNDASTSLGDFRVESDANSTMMFVDAGENVVSLGMTSSSIPTWIGNNSVVVADNLYGFQATSYNEACYNISVDNNYTYFLHNGYYSTGGWTQRKAGYGPAMYRMGSASHQWEVKSDVGTDDTNFSWRPIMNISETNGFVWNDSGYDTDFRVESDGKTHALYVNAGDDLVMVGRNATTETTGVYGTVLNATGATANVRTYGDGTNHSHYQFIHNGNGAVGSITTLSTGATYNTTSDRRLKENIEAITDGTEKLMAMNPVTHTWKNVPEAPAVHGFIAQEMIDIVPEAVTGDPTGEEMMSMDYGRITPVLVAALQDAHKKITELETRLAAVEGK